MILRNPTDTEVSITVLGVTKSIAPLSTIEVDSAFGEVWLSVHEFLQVSGSAEKAVKKPVEKIEVPEEIVPEIQKEIAVEKVIKQNKK